MYSSPIFISYYIAGVVGLTVSYYLPSSLLASAISSSDSGIKIATVSTAIGQYVLRGINANLQATSVPRSPATTALSPTPTPQWRNSSQSVQVLTASSRPINTNETNLFSSALSCNAAYNAWSSSSVDWVLQRFALNTSTTTSTLSTYDLKTSISYDLTTLCDGKPRIANQRSDITRLSTYSTIHSTEVYTITAFTTSDYTVPPPTCTLDNKACKLISSAHEAQPLNSSFSPAAICPTSGPSCTVQVDSATMLYWPVTTMGDAACGNNVTTITATPTGEGPNTAIVNGTTYTSPSVYIKMQGLVVISSSGVDHFNTFSSTDAVIPVQPSEVSSVCGYHGNDGTHSFNFADMASPVPWSAYACMPQCWGEWSAACLPVGVLPYQPNIAFPTQISNLNRINSDWHGTCRLGWGEFNSIWDPPQALQQEGTLAGPTTPQAASATPTATLVTMPTPAAPSASGTSPAQQTSAVTAGAASSILSASAINSDPSESSLPPAQPGNTVPVQSGDLSALRSNDPSVSGASRLSDLQTGDPSGSQRASYLSRTQQSTSSLTLLSIVEPQTEGQGANTRTQDASQPSNSGIDPDATTSPIDPQDPQDPRNPIASLIESVLANRPTEQPSVETASASVNSGNLEAGGAPRKSWTSSQNAPGALITILGQLSDAAPPPNPSSRGQTISSDPSTSEALGLSPMPSSSREGTRLRSSGTPGSENASPDVTATANSDVSSGYLPGITNVESVASSAGSDLSPTVSNRGTSLFESDHLTASEYSKTASPSGTNLAASSRQASTSLPSGAVPSSDATRLKGRHSLAAVLLYLAGSLLLVSM